MNKTSWVHKKENDRTGRGQRMAPYFKSTGQEMEGRIINQLLKEKNSIKVQMWLLGKVNFRGMEPFYVKSMKQAKVRKLLQCSWIQNA